MGIAALILGIIGGLFGLMLSVFGYGLAAIAGAGGATGAGLFKFLMIIIPLASLVGGGMAIAKPLIGGALMLISAALVLLIFGFNFFTFLAVVLSGVGGILAIVAGQSAPQQV